MAHERCGACRRSGRQRSLSPGTGSCGCGVWRCGRRGIRRRGRCSVRRRCRSGIRRYRRCSIRCRWCGIRRRIVRRWSVAWALPFSLASRRRRSGRWRTLLLRLHLRLYLRLYPRPSLRLHLRLCGRRSAGRGRRLWRCRRRYGRRRSWMRWCGRRGRHVRRWRHGRCRARRRRCGRRSGSVRRRSGRRRRRCGSGRRGGRRRGTRRRCCSGRRGTRWGCCSGRRRARRWRRCLRRGCLRWRLGFSIGTDFAGGGCLRHHHRCGLRVRWRVDELHRRQSCRGKQHEPKFCHGGFGPRKIFGNKVRRSTNKRWAGLWRLAKRACFYFVREKVLIRLCSLRIQAVVSNRSLHRSLRHIRRTWIQVRLRSRQTVNSGIGRGIRRARSRRSSHR
jgi:hypothetical protein